MSKRLPSDLKESVWTSVTEGFARKAEERLRICKEWIDGGVFFGITSLRDQPCPFAKDDAQSLGQDSRWFDVLI